jgi:hypothetical protein
VSLVEKHLKRNIIRVQLKQNFALKSALLHQGVHETEQYSVLDGVLKHTFWYEVMRLTGLQTQTEIKNGRKRPFLELLSIK